MERGPMPTHPSSTHPVFSTWGPGLETACHTCLSHVLKDGRREWGRASRPLLPSSPGGRWDGEVAPRPPLPPFRRDPCPGTGSHDAQAGRRDGDGSHTHPPHVLRARRWDGDRILHLPWETQPSLGTSLIAGRPHPAFQHLLLL